MKRLPFFLLLICCTLTAYTQTIYSYDNAGNRIKRMANAPDLSIRITFIPSSVTGTTPISGTLKITIMEVNGIPSNGSLITARVRTHEVYTINASAGTVFSGWTYQGVTGVFHTFTSSMILNNSNSQFLVPLSIYPNGGLGHFPVSAALAQNSGGDLNTSNNSDQETISTAP